MTRELKTKQRNLNVVSGGSYNQVLCKKAFRVQFMVENNWGKSYEVTISE